MRTQGTNLVLNLLRSRLRAAEKAVRTFDRSCGSAHRKGLLPIAGEAEIEALTELLLDEAIALGRLREYAMGHKLPAREDEIGQAKREARMLRAEAEVFSRAKRILDHASSGPFHYVFCGAGESFGLRLAHIREDLSVLGNVVDRRWRRRAQEMRAASKAA